MYTTTSFDRQWWFHGRSCHASEQLHSLSASMMPLLCAADYVPGHHAPQRMAYAGPITMAVGREEGMSGLIAPAVSTANGETVLRRGGRTTAG